MCSAFDRWALESHVDCDLNVFTMYPVDIWALVPSVRHQTECAKGDEYRRYMKTCQRQERMAWESVVSNGEPITNSDMYSYVSNLAMIAPDDNDDEPDIQDQGIPDEKVYCEPNYSDNDFYQMEDETYQDPYKVNDDEDLESETSDLKPDKQTIHATNE